MESMTVNSRDDSAQWAIARARSILEDQGSDLAAAVRNEDEQRISETANALGQAIVDALLDACDGLVDGD